MDFFFFLSLELKKEVKNRKKKSFSFVVYWKTLYKLSQLYKQNKTNKKTSVKKKKKLVQY